MINIKFNQQDYKVTINASFDYAWLKKMLLAMKIKLDTIGKSFKNRLYAAKLIVKFLIVAPRISSCEGSGKEKFVYSYRNDSENKSFNLDKIKNSVLDKIKFTAKSTKNTAIKGAADG